MRVEMMTAAMSEDATIEVEFFCFARKIRGDDRARVLAAHRGGDPSWLASSVLMHAMRPGPRATAERGWRAVRDGADLYALMLATPPDWDRAGAARLDLVAALGGACIDGGMAAADVAYAVAELRRSDGSALAWWLEMAATGNPGATTAVIVRAGCLGYGRSRLWLRDRDPRPDLTSLTPYLAAA